MILHKDIGTEKHLKLIELARPYLEQNELGISHTERVLIAVQDNLPLYHMPAPLGDMPWSDILRALAVLHDVGGPTKREQYAKGPALADRLMRRLGYPSLERGIICRFIATHHERSPNPHPCFQALFDADHLVMFSEEEFAGYDKEGVDWGSVIDSFYNDEVRKKAVLLLASRKKG